MSEIKKPNHEMIEALKKIEVGDTIVSHSGSERQITFINGDEIVYQYRKANDLKVSIKTTTRSELENMNTEAIKEIIKITKK